MHTEQNELGHGAWGMRLNRQAPQAKRIVWGVLLIILGGLLFLARLNFINIPSLWKLWPMVLVATGVGHMLEGRPGAAVAMTLMGLAFFAAEFRWLGLSYGTFWPLIVISVGVGLVLRAITGEDAACAKKEA